jgi:hypothetical protein
MLGALFLRIQNNAPPNEAKVARRSNPSANETIRASIRKTAKEAGLLASKYNLEFARSGRDRNPQTSGRKKKIGTIKAIFEKR